MNICIYLLFVIYAILTLCYGESTTITTTTTESVVTENSSSDNFETTTTTVITPIQKITENVTENEDKPELLPTPLASKRQRSYIESVPPPPFTIIKHRTRYVKSRSKPRRRLKSPKPIYGPPNYIPPEPIGYYNAQLDGYDETSTLSFKPKIKYKDVKNSKPNYFDLNSEINIHSIPITDFKQYIPSSNNFDFTKNEYEKNPITFDLYENLHGGASAGDTYNSNSGKGNYGEYYVVNKESPNNYHQKYPPSQFSYNSHETYEIPSSVSYPSKTISQPLQEITNHNHNPNYDNNIKTFAEPPVDIHYTYSTQYDIESPPPTTQIKYSAPQYLPPDPSADPVEDYNYSPDTAVYKNVHTDYYNDGGGTGQFAEPPHHYFHDPIAPIQNSRLPLEHSQKTTVYDYPKSSYEVPLYNSPSFDTSTLNKEYYPPNIPNAGNNYQPEQINALAKQSQKVEITLPRNLTKIPVKIINQNKSKFEAATTISTTTAHPEDDFNEPIEYIESLLRSSTLKPKRKRKRTRAPSTEKIHNLDSDELRDAYASETKENLYRILPENFKPSLMEHSSNAVQNGRPVRLETDIDSTPEFNNNDFTEFLWEPIKLGGDNSGRNRNNFNSKKNTSSATENSSRNHPPMPTKTDEFVSIQKSQSHSYYDGTISPDVFKQLTRVRQYSRMDTDQNDSADFTVISSGILVSGNNQQTNKNDNQQANENANQQRSFNPRGFVIDDNSKEIKTNLKLENWSREIPKNHKIYSSKD